MNMFEKILNPFEKKKGVEEKLAAEEAEMERKALNNYRSMIKEVQSQDVFNRSDNTRKSA